MMSTLDAAHRVSKHILCSLLRFMFIYNVLDKVHMFFVRGFYNLNSFIHSSMVLQPFVRPWPLFFSSVIFFTQTVGLLGRVISPSQGRYLHTGQHKHRINACTYISALSGI
jgi:hypothetical protein